MSDQLHEIKKQHWDSYKSALIEIVENNTNVLVNEDIKLLFKKPPLDSMDTISSKYLSVARKNNVVLNFDNLKEIINNYREYLLKICEKIKKCRLNYLFLKINDFKYIDDNSVIKFNKKDFININRDIKKIVKQQMKDGFDKYLLKYFDKIVDSKIENDTKKNILNEITKYVNGNYQKQLLENLDIKILVKDTILINACKEQNDRYIFALNNSRLFDSL